MTKQTEPVAYLKDIDNAPFQTIDFASVEEEGAYPVYSHPAPVWQGLSDDEIRGKIPSEARWWDMGDEAVINFARAIEQALKEKNA